MSQAPLAVRRLGPDATLREIVRQDMLRRQQMMASKPVEVKKPRF